MLRRSAWAVLAVLATAVAASAQSVPATLAVVEKADRDQQTIVVKQVLTVYEARTVKQAVMVDGMIVEREVTVLVPVLKETLVTMALKGAKAYTGDGKALPEKDLWQRLRPGAVVVWGDERLLQPQYTRVFRPEAVLFVSPFSPPPPPKVER